MVVAREQTLVGCSQWHPEMLTSATRQLDGTIDHGRHDQDFPPGNVASRRSSGVGSADRTRRSTRGSRPTRDAQTPIFRRLHPVI
jgi:hypothetical protein